MTAEQFQAARRARADVLVRSHNELEALLKRDFSEMCSEREFNRASPTARRACAACGLKRKEAYGPDPCLGYLPGVRNACCGHGVREGYVQFENDITIRGVFHTEHGPGPGNRGTPQS